MSTTSDIPKNPTLVKLEPPDLHQDNRFSSILPILIFLSGLVFFTACHSILRRLLHRYFSKRIEEGVIYDITERCISSLQGVLTTVAGVLIVKNCQDIMHDNYWLTDTYAMFGFPYFYYDIWAGYKTHIHDNPHLLKSGVGIRIKNYVKFNKMMICHHLILPSAFFPIVLVYRRGAGDFFIGMFFTIEIVIPFISLRHILARLRMKTSPLYLASGILMIVTFTIGRILIFPYLYWQYALYKSISLWEVPGAIPLKCNVSCLLLLVFQVYWLLLMVRGLIKVIYRIVKIKSKKMS